MTSVEKAKAVSRSVLVPALAFLAYNVQETLAKTLEDSWAFVLVIFGLGLSFYLLEGLTSSIVTSRRTRLLRRLLFPSDFIEGYWVDVIMGPDSDEGRDEKTILFGGVSYYFFENGQLSASGINFAPDGTMIGSYSTEFTQFKNHTFQYVHRWNSPDVPGSDQIGYGQYAFQIEDGPPTSYRGYFWDAHVSSGMDIFGARSPVQKFHEKDVIEQKREVFLTYLNSFKG